MLNFSDLFFIINVSLQFCRKKIESGLKLFSSLLFVQVESAVRPLLDAYFPPLSGVQVLAQPGTFYVASAFSLAVNVIGKKMVTCHWDSLTQGELCNSFFSPSFSL